MVREHVQVMAGVKELPDQQKAQTTITTKRTHPIHANQIRITETTIVMVTEHAPVMDGVKGHHAEDQMILKSPLFNSSFILLI